MSINLYRLFAVQKFNGEKIAVYTKQEYPDPEILGDAERICRGELTRLELTRSKEWLYEKEENKKELTYWIRLINRSREIIENNENIDKAIFVETEYFRDWKGTNVVYHNKYFDELKTVNKYFDETDTDIPIFSGCEPEGEITL